ncbi:PQQ-dependent sugar dehydrogenase [Pseudaminobacter arsenicus]|uniref:PQQ-dependent sugar dehydrogenase n=1 Tax=Borborobacter arsenicus TaxID=1851146 RepID=A0A432V4A1_9HYPH|nr:PQQ-dependent sugar dehydrogenase [Pseudaminobacter arsenicus]RUM96940.1 PQQ-dependent sugar dehydrogenase [Pseudaminobacter arsenicus]
MRKTTKAVATSLVCAVLTSVPGTAAQAEPRVFDTETGKVQADTLTDGLEHPWGLDFLPDGDAIVTERPGRIRILSQDGLSEPLPGVPEVVAEGQGGLLDIVASPNFVSDKLVYFSFSQPGEGGAGTAVARAKLQRDGASARLDQVEVIFSMAKKTGTSHHFGSRLVFGRDGSLFITTGDRGDGDRAQDMQDSAGAVLRINGDGSIPADNPSPDGSKSLPEIWSKGHRNVQGATLDPLTGSLVTVEHGARGGDEVNQPQAGRNYGWPVISYGRHYSGFKIGVGTQAEGYEQPLYYWDPSIAPSGLASYQGDMFPGWKGDLLVGSLKFALLARLDRDDQGKIVGEERMLDGAFGRIRDVNVAPDGAVWLLTDESDGAIIRLSRPD